MLCFWFVEAVLAFSRNVPTKSEAPTPPGQFFLGMLLCFLCFSAFMFFWFLFYLLFRYLFFLLFLLFCFYVCLLLCLYVFCFFRFCFSCFSVFLLLCLSTQFLYFSSVMCFRCSTSCFSASLLPFFTVSLFGIFFALFSPVCNPNETPARP